MPDSGRYHKKHRMMKKLTSLTVISLLGTGLALANGTNGSDNCSDSIVLWCIGCTAILYFILFFKLWSMTNTIKKIQKGINKEDTPLIDEEVFYPLLLKGEKEKAKEYLDNAVMADVGRRVKWVRAQDTITRETCTPLEKREVKIKKTLEPYYEAIGYTFPDELVSKENLDMIVRLSGIKKKRKED